MAAQPVRFRERAVADVEAAIDHYRLEAGDAVALDFIGALEKAVARIGRSPQVGSLRFSYDLDIPELRAMSTARFPYVIFYVPREGAIDVWRVLHARRDIPGVLADER